MKKSLLLIVLGAIFFTACDPQITPDDPQITPAQPILYPTEEPEAVTNDFTLVKGCIGKSHDEADTLITGQGFILDHSDEYGIYYSKTENDIIKDLTLVTPAYVTMVAHGDNYESLRSVFKQWIQEMRHSATYNHLVRASYSLRIGTGGSEVTFNTPEELIAAVDDAAITEYISASFSGNDIYANQYELSLSSRSKGVFMVIGNPRAEQPSDDFTESDLKESDLKKHILISKVDYMTFRYKGFYVLNVSDKVDSDSLIPIISAYQAPSDFGSIKLYYRNTDNILLDGTIIWNGCGHLNFPDGFRAGLPTNEAMPFPGIEYFARLGEDGKYIETDNQWEMQHIWETVSHQKEFQHYFGNSTKKVAVYLYAPSVGLFDPNVAYYLVFTEQ